ncbi:MAG: hypothetical protein ACRD5H_13750, partial [Nitrososphaerales archaeon]
MVSTASTTGRKKCSAAESVSREPRNSGARRGIGHTKYDMTGMVTAVYDGANNETKFFYDDNLI